LEHVSLSHSYAKWSRRGFTALARFLPSASKLKNLDLSGEGWTNEGAALVSAALAGNETLKEISFDDNDEIKSAGWKGFSTLLSNNSTIMDTYYSNHTLQQLLRKSRYHDDDDEKKTLGDELFTLLKINTFCNKKFDAARLKIILSHLEGGSFSMESYADMDLAALPHVLAYAGKTNDALASVYKHAEKDTGLMYKFVRGLAPVLFDASPSTAIAGQKRKTSEA